MSNSAKTTNKFATCVLIALLVSGCVLPEVEVVDHLAAGGTPAYTSTGGPATGGASSLSKTGTIVLSITDECDDGYPIYFYFGDATGGGWWPGPDTFYETKGYGIATSASLLCTLGATICLGGEDEYGDTWGFEGGPPSDSWCVTCTNGLTDGWILTCS